MFVTAAEDAKIVSGEPAALIDHAVAIGKLLLPSHLENPSHVGHGPDWQRALQRLASRSMVPGGSRDKDRRHTPSKEQRRGLVVPRRCCTHVQVNTAGSRRRHVTSSHRNAWYEWPYPPFLVIRMAAAKPPLSQCGKSTTTAARCQVSPTATRHDAGSASASNVVVAGRLASFVAQVVVRHAHRELDAERHGILCGGRDRGEHGCWLRRHRG